MIFFLSCEFKFSIQLFKFQGSYVSCLFSIPQSGQAPFLRITVDSDKFAWMSVLDNCPARDLKYYKKSFMEKFIPLRWVPPVQSLLLNQRISANMHIPLVIAQVVQTLTDNIYTLKLHFETMWSVCRQKALKWRRIKCF